MYSKVVQQHLLKPRLNILFIFHTNLFMKLSTFLSSTLCSYVTINIVIKSVTIKSVILNIGNSPQIGFTI